MASIEKLYLLRETAARWYARAGQEDASAETRGALSVWLDQSPEHADAYQAIARTWSALKSAAQDRAILELRQQTARRLTTTASATHHPLRWAVAALIIVFLGAALSILVQRTGFELSAFAWFNEQTSNPATHSYTTKTGGRLAIALDDGTHVTLNTDTQLEVSFSKKSRTVQLSRGQALFEVAKDVSRPFVVQTASRRFIAVGTVFDVRVEREQVKVTMLEGTVRAEGIAPDFPLRTTVIAGEQLIARAQTEDHVRRVDPERETSWRRGQVIFDNTPLGEAVAELNRYSGAHIELADPKLADLRLSGTFATGSTSTFVEAVTAYFPIQVDHDDEHTVTLKARP